MENYAVGEPLEARFYLPGLHDTYLLVAAEPEFVLRIYRNGWRSCEEIAFELDWLDHLRKKRAPVAAPLPANTGELALRIASPEGERVAALFPYARGLAPAGGLTLDQSRALGHAVAKVHRCATGFTTPHKRTELDGRYLIGASIAAISRFLDAGARAYLQALGERLQQDWPNIPKATDTFGLCIGDVNATNVHIDTDGSLTLFDFDQCGYGYRAFEIAKFASSLRDDALKPDLLEAFLAGYEHVRTLSPAERQAIPYFELVATVWVLAIHAWNVDRIGHKRLEKPFWDRNLATVKALEAALSHAGGAGVARP